MSLRSSIDIPLFGLIDIILIAVTFAFSFIGVLAAISHIVSKISFLPKNLAEIIRSPSDMAGTYVMGKGLLIIIPPNSHDLLNVLTLYLRLNYQESLRCVSRGCVIYLMTKSNIFENSADGRICIYGFLNKICAWWGNLSVIKNLNIPLEIYDKEVYYIEEFRGEPTFYYLYLNGTMKVKVKKKEGKIFIS